MDQTDQSQAGASQAAGDDAVSPRADLWSSLVWIALGIAIVWSSLGMDRLERLGANIYTAPGLVPGLLGAAIAFMGLLLLLRAVRGGALRRATALDLSPARHWRLIFSLGWSLIYALVVVKSALPFWLVTAIYVAVFVVVFQYKERRVKNQIPRGLAVAVVHGLISGALIQYVFEQLFFVRLP